MSKKTLFGIIIVIIGVNIFWNSIFPSSGSLIAPIIFFVLGLFFYQRQRKLLATIFFILSASIFFDQTLGVNLVSLLVGIVFLYYGLKLMKDKKKAKKKETRQENHQVKQEDKKERDETKHVTKNKPEVAITDVTPNQGENDVADKEQEFTQQKRHEERIFSTPSIRRSLIGDIHYTREQFELRDMTIWNGLGDVRLDVSKAIIPEGETVVIIQGLIGQIDVYVPDDLAISVQASSMIGEISLFHEKHSGLNQQLNVSSQDYKQAPRRVKFILSTVIGEVKVRAV
ncbi:cell wall-active antibiotics response protein LiaF [Halalkalibacter urbisdiaboli]|uniref:cell wall-active antibiotics response protein LiaF n=1 Tax=Halalkalibacter urbisdiaboli TaxID=1960589 RepID=UPI000B438C67|nr:cell wall-active antibiotics response protein LiaF [Halalkalibacter urbisdiaboli]